MQENCSSKVIKGIRKNLKNIVKSCKSVLITKLWSYNKGKMIECAGHPLNSCE